MKFKNILMITRKNAHDIGESDITTLERFSDKRGPQMLICWFGFLVEHFNFEVAHCGKLSSMFWAFSTISLLQC